MEKAELHATFAKTADFALHFQPRPLSCQRRELVTQTRVTDGHAWKTDAPHTRCAAAALKSRLSGHVGVDSLHVSSGGRRGCARPLSTKRPAKGAGNAIIGGCLHFLFRPSKIHYALRSPKLASDLRAHFDGHAASCQANKVVCTPPST